MRPTNRRRIDTRHNLWISVPIDKNTQNIHEDIRQRWQTATDQEIMRAKTDLLAVFQSEVQLDHQHVKGMACKDFIYLFSNDNSTHLFVPTSGTQTVAYLYDCQGGTGECDMYFDANSTFDLILIQSQCM